MLVGLPVGVISATLTPWPYEIQLLVTGGAGVLGMIGGLVIGPSPDPERIAAFQDRVDPPGFWPGRSRKDALRQLARKGAGMAAVMAGVVLGLKGGILLFFGG
jgi:hypothetical protein